MCLFCTLEALSFILAPDKPGMLVCARNPSIQEVKDESATKQFEANLGYLRPCLKMKIKRTHLRKLGLVEHICNSSIAKPKQEESEFKTNLS